MFFILLVMFARLNLFCLEFCIWVRYIALQAKKLKFSDTLLFRLLTPGFLSSVSLDVIDIYNLAILRTAVMAVKWIATRRANHVNFYPFDLANWKLVP